MDTIFTLNARDNIFLDVIGKRFNIDQPQMRVEIQTMFRSMVQDLEKSGLHYVDLKTALVPSLDNHEVGFIFDSTAIESSIYGAEVMSRILPLIDLRSTQSCLVGDLIAGNDAQEFIFSLLEQFLVGNRAFEYIHSTLLFCVYLNNLTKKSLARIHENLQSFTAYLGYVPCTYSSLAKTYLSTSLERVMHFPNWSRASIVAG